MPFLAEFFVNWPIVCNECKFQLIFDQKTVENSEQIKLSAATQDI